MAAIDADIVGLIELQNDAGASVADLVAALNARRRRPVRLRRHRRRSAPTPSRWRSSTGRRRSRRSAPYEILDSAVDPDFIDTRNRPALIQTFAENGDRRALHGRHQPLQVEGLGVHTTVGDPDLRDGQGNCSVTRTRAARGARRLPGHRPDRQRRPRRHHPRRPQLVPPGGPDHDARGRRLHRPHRATSSATTPTATCSTASSATSTTPWPPRRWRPRSPAPTEWHINADEPPLFDYNDDVARRRRGARSSGSRTPCRSTPPTPAGRATTTRWSSASTSAASPSTTR